MTDANNKGYIFTCFFDNFVTHKYMDVDKHLYYTVYNVKLG